MAKFKMSVIIPTYNRRELLAHTLHSLANQTLDKSEYEVIIGDDGSSDDTFEMVKTYEERINIRYAYQIDDGYRPGAARNMGIRLAEGTYCLFIDSGIIVKSDCLEQHVLCHDQWEREVAVLGYIYGYGGGTNEIELKTLVDPRDADSSIARLVETGKDWIWDLRENIFQKYNDEIEKLSVPWAYFLGGHFSVKTRSLHNIGLFDENFDGTWGNEDIDVGYRLFKAGHKIVLCRAACVLHLPHDEMQGEELLEWRSEQGAKNARYFHEKFQSPETRMFYEFHLKDLENHSDCHEYTDFHEAFINNYAENGSLTPKSF